MIGYEKCSYCGFCEYVCPTYLETGDRSLGPRGRVWAAREVLIKGVLTKTVEVSLYTCLLCRACEPECPSSVPIVDVILRARRRIAEVSPAR